MNFRIIIQLTHEFELIVCIKISKGIIVDEAADEWIGVKLEMHANNLTNKM